MSLWSIVSDSAGSTSRPGFGPPRAAADTARRAVRLYRERFGRAPRWLAAAPGRVNLIGEHTDYNDGFVLPIAIDRHVAIAAGPAASAETPRLRACTEAFEASADIPLAGRRTPGQPTWANYLRGVVDGFAVRRCLPGAIDLAIASDLPVGGGLSSSAALEVATAVVLEAASRRKLDPHDLARLCRQAERDFAGVPCGVMDQLASVLGSDASALLIDCESETVHRVPFAPEGNVTLLVTNTNVKHALADGAYRCRRAECIEAARALGVPSLRYATPDMVDWAAARLDPVLRRRARHVTTENARTLAAAQLLEANDPEPLGELMYESHRSLRDDFEVSSPELDALVDIARDLGERGGVLGARMTGGGFGGCTVTLVRTESVSAVAPVLHRDFERRTGRAPEVFISRPTKGAHLLDVTALG
jgi:galactokinase